MNLTLLSVATTFVLEIVLGLLPEESQLQWDIDIMQAQKVLLGLGALTALSYRSPVGKGMILLGLIWSSWVLLTDHFIPRDWPSWIPAIEGTLFLLWLIYLWKRNASLSRGKETGQPDGDDSVSSSGAGWRRGSRWR